MGAFAAVRIPIDVTGCRGGGAVAHEIVSTFPGTRNYAFSGDSGTLAFELQFPGNLGALVERLRGRAIVVGATAEVSVPVKSLLGEAPDGVAVARLLAEGPEAWDVQFARRAYVSAGSLAAERIQASIVPCTEAMHALYDALLAAGLVASDASSAAS